MSSQAKQPRTPLTPLQMRQQSLSRDPPKLEEFDDYGRRFVIYQMFWEHFASLTYVTVDQVFFGAIRSRDRDLEALYVWIENGYLRFLCTSSTLDPVELPEEERGLEDVPVIDFEIPPISGVVQQ